MNFGLKAFVSSIALTLAAAAAPASAQTAAAGTEAGISVGTKVVDTAGGEVGTISAVRDNELVVKTDKHEVPVARSSFTPTADGLLFGLTRDQLNAQVDQAMAAQQGPKVNVGETVYDPQGGVVGTVQELDEQFATLKLPNSAVKLPIDAFARGPNGPVIGETAASLEAKASSAAGTQ